MFNGFDDSMEDEKANQEAFERSQLLLGKQRNTDQKLSFLNSLSDHQDENEFNLVKPVVSMTNSSKIIIDQNALKSSSQEAFRQTLLNEADPNSFATKPIDFDRVDENISLHLSGKFANREEKMSVCSNSDNASDSSKKRDAKSSRKDQEESCERSMASEECLMRKQDSDSNLPHLTEAEISEEAELQNEQDGLTDQPEPQADRDIQPKDDNEEEKEGTPHFKQAVEACQVEDVKDNE